MRCLPFVLVTPVALFAAGCSSDSTSNSTLPTSPAPVLTDNFTGTVPAPVNGTPQSDIKTFTTTQSGTITLTLTSAVETLPGGVLFPSVIIGIGIGTLSGTACSVPSGNSTTAQSSTTPVLSGTLSAGSYCVLVSDVINQSGPVAYTFVLTHPP
jgi:H+/Cl- antiporter ClcA